MHAEEIEAGKLFGAGQQFLIPLWQRHYSWERTQWDELWNDLARVLADPKSAHFVGSIVLNQLPWHGLPSEAHRYWVVDGQQRVTTMTILMCAIRDRLALLEPDEAAQAKAHASYTSQLLLNKDLQDGHISRLVLQEQDRASLDPIIAGTWTGTVSTRIERAYDFFRLKLSGKSQEELLHVMATSLKRLTAVWVTLEESDNAHRVFQTLNAGGKKLRQSDLVRNYFFLLLAEQGDEFYKTSWRKMETELGDTGLEEFFVAWSISQGHVGSMGSLFAYFQKDLRDHEASVDAVLKYGNSLVETSRLYRHILAPVDSGYGKLVKRTLTDLANWGTTPAQGLLLWLLRAENAEILSESELYACLEMVLSFVARRQLAGYEPNLHKSILASTARKLRASKLTHGDLVAFMEFVLSQGDDVRTWPSNEEITSDIRSVALYSRTRQSWTFTLLERVDRELYNNPKHAPDHIDRNKYTIEHVLPQTLTDEWISDLKKWGDNTPHRLHESRLHVLGNLTLTPINSELSNEPYAVKQPQLADDPLRLNSYFKEASTWTQTHIDERSSSLATAANAQFPAPLRGADLAAAKARFADLDDDTAGNGDATAELEQDEE